MPATTIEIIKPTSKANKLRKFLLPYDHKISVTYLLLMMIALYSILINQEMEKRETYMNNQRVQQDAFIREVEIGKQLIETKEQLIEAKEQLIAIDAWDELQTQTCLNYHPNHGGCRNKVWTMITPNSLTSETADYFWVNIYPNLERKTKKYFTDLHDRGHELEMTLEAAKEVASL